MKKFVITIAIIFYGLWNSAQSWNGKKCAVVLTYDDALNVHLDKVIPVLDSLQYKGTFYLSGYFPGSRERIADWRKAAAHGHELGNHTLFHPCNGNLPGRQWVSSDNNLENYSLRRIRDEVRMNNVFLTAIDGKTKRTFAYPCGDMTIRDSLYLDKIDFVAARGVKAEMPKIDKVDLFNIESYAINGQTGEELIALVKKNLANNTLLVFLFHGVGGEHSINVSLQAHNELLRFLKQNDKDIWIAPMMEVAEYIQKKQSQGK
jgi:peptidoglycan/xylan/chitin deacetylase (PgdA/CDA1 family)